METVYAQLPLFAQKRCSGCGKTLPIIDFYPSQSNPNAFRARCKDCTQRAQKPEGHAAAAEHRALRKKGMQRCTGCGEVKSISAFSIRDDLWDFRRICKQCRARAAKTYVEAHREQVTAVRRLHYENNRPRILAEAIEYYASHRNQVNAYTRQWRRDNPEHVQRLNKDYIKRKPEVIKACGQRRRARLKNAVGNVTTSEWVECLAYFNGKCAYCGCDLSVPTMEHMIPLSKGGPHVIENIVPACMSCNSRKSDRDLMGFLMFLSAADDATAGLAGRVAEKARM